MHPSRIRRLPMRHKLTAVFATFLLSAAVAPFVAQAGVLQEEKKEPAVVITGTVPDLATEVEQLRRLRAQTLAQDVLRSKPKPEPKPEAEPVVQEAPAEPVSTGPTLTVTSTAYCLQGTMANGQT